MAQLVRLREPVDIYPGGINSDARCPRRAALDLAYQPPQRFDSRRRFALRNLLVETVTAAHAAAAEQNGRLEVPPDLPAVADLTVEERARLDGAVEHYLDLAEALPGRWRPTRGDDLWLQREHASRRYTVRSRVDLLLDHDDGVVEVRLLRLDHPREPASEDPQVLVAALTAPAPGPVLVRRFDLSPGGGIDEARFTPEERAAVDEQIAAGILGRLAATDAALDGGPRPEPVPGWWCAWCPWTRSCPAVAQDRVEVVLLRGTGEPDPSPPAPGPPFHLPDTRSPGPETLDALGVDTRPFLVVDASRLGTWQECPRKFRNRYMLGLPAISDESTEARLGRVVHAELHARHADPAVHDSPGLVTAEARALADDRVAEMVDRHRAVCPAAAGATYLGGEETLVWLPDGQRLLLSGKLDAVWRHADGTVEVRDYKTGKPGHASVDLGARLYALLAAAQPPGSRLAPARGRLVRVAYEQLADGGQHPAAVQADREFLEEGWRQVQTAAAALAAEQAWPTRPGLCQWCGYRDVCPDAEI